MRTSSPHEKSLPVFSAVLAWYRKRTGAVHSEPERDTPAAVEAAPRASDGPHVEPADSVRQLAGVDLLFRCMAMLQIDPDELAADDPLLFRELQGLCSLCAWKEQCTDDLARKFDEVRLEKWGEYCPNAATLMAVGAVQNCTFAAQHLKKPRATGVLGAP